LLIFLFIFIHIWLCFLPYQTLIIDIFSCLVSHNRHHLMLTCIHFQPNHTFNVDVHVDVHFQPHLTFIVILLIFSHMIFLLLTFFSFSATSDFNCWHFFLFSATSDFYCFNDIIDAFNNGSRQTSCNVSCRSKND
jgi:hypothetical protein